MWELLTMGSIVVLEKGVGFDRTVKQHFHYTVFPLNCCVAVATSRDIAWRLRFGDPRAPSHCLRGSYLPSEWLWIRTLDAKLLVEHVLQCLRKHVHRSAAAQVPHGSGWCGLREAARAVSMRGYEYLWAEYQADAKIVVLKGVLICACQNIFVKRWLFLLPIFLSNSIAHSNYFTVKLARSGIAMDKFCCGKSYVWISVQISQNIHNKI